MYDTLAQGYEELYGEEQRKKLEKVAFVLKGRILDIGAGTGIVARHFPHVVSLDPSLEMLKQAPGEKVLGVAEHLPFKANSFDTVVSLTALHHTDIDQVIGELKRLQAPNMAFSILKKSKKCEEIVSKLKEAFGMEVFEEEKDILLIKEIKH
ncbi:methyltransferase domain-containing protein [Candidatus Woesearchaeota archaeon]|nr:methyltransferase domain-containing protein [Candidatus Woesearchaeota archaeon]